MTHQSTLLRARAAIPAAKKDGRRVGNRAIAASGDLMERVERQPAAREP